MKHPCNVRSRVAVCAAFVVAAVSLTACGGGGGGGGGNNNGGGGNNPPPPPTGTYTGVTSAATLAASNTPTIAGGLLFELGLASGDRPVPAQLGSGKLTIPHAVQAASKARFARSKQSLKPVDTQNCAGGGTVRIDDQTNDNGIGAVTLTYSACSEDGLRTDGVVRLQVRAFDLAANLPTDFTATFDGYTQTEGSFAVDIDGDVITVITPTSLTTTYDTVARYRPENVQHAMQNLVVRQTVLSGNTDSVTITGRFFHSAHGYVDVTTREALTVDITTGIASAGVLRLRNTATALADVRFTSPDQLVLSLDENGDGAADRELTATGLTGLRAANHIPSAHAGPDATIAEGHGATLSGSGFDWDGDALTYAWTCDNSPVGPFPIGNSAQLDFQPPAPGTYVIHLTVNDGQLTIRDEMTLTVTDNVTPLANAGADVETVDHQTVVMDAGASTDPENDPLHYGWTLLSAPPSSSAPATAEGVTFDFAADLPGTYTYRLTVADAFGQSEDEVSIVVNRLIGFGFSSAMIVDPSTTPQLITETVPINVSHVYSGPPVPLTVSTDVPWLDVVSAAGQTGPNATVVVTLDTTQLASMANGNHLAHLTVTPAGHTPHSAELLLMLALPRIEHVTPYVTYVGQPAPVTFYGNRLDQTLGATLVINGIEVQGFAESMANRARITLPALPVGEYTMHVKNNLGVVIPTGRFVVRTPPTYPDGATAAPGRIEALDYDVERDAFYGVSYNELTAVYSAWRMRFANAQWHTDVIDAPEAQSITLNADGTKLLVTGPNCTVREVDPDTLQVTHTAARSSCFSEFWGLAAGLADGRVVVGNTSQWATAYEYPAFTDSTSQFPSTHSPHYKLNRNRDRLLWAETPTISPPNELYFYDLPTDAFSQIVLQDPDTYLFSWNLAISDDGHRMLHRQYVYEDGQYIGSLPGLTNPFVSPALTANGDRAVVLDQDNHVLALYDLSAAPNFTKIGDIGAIAANAGGPSRVVLLPDASVAFAFTMTSGQNGIDGFQLFVRNLP